MSQASSFKLLEKGSNSEIFLYKDNVVLKMVDVNYPKQSKHLRNEFEILSTVAHPNIIKCMSLKQDISVSGMAPAKSRDSAALPTSHRDVLIMEYAAEGSLLSFIKRNPKLPQTARLHIARQLVEAVQHLHLNQHIAHRDLKLDNILVRAGSPPSIALADFGFALRCPSVPGSPEPTAHSYKGTRRGYMAPELHRLTQHPGQPYNPFKLDIFSLAVVIFALFFNRLPFQYATPTDKYYSLLSHLNTPELFWERQKITELEYPHIELLPDLQNLLEAMWRQNPKERFTIQQVVDSDWFRAAKCQDSTNYKVTTSNTSSCTDDVQLKKKMNMKESEKDKKSAAVQAEETTVEQCVPTEEEEAMGGATYESKKEVDSTFQHSQ